MGLFSAITGIIGGAQSASAVSNAADEQVKGLVKSADTVDRTVGYVNPAIGDAYRTAGAGVLEASSGAATGVLSAAEAAARGVNTAATTANGYLDPYMTTGRDATITLGQMFAPGGEGSRQFTAEDMKTMDPGFDFRIQQAQKALERSAAARGNGMGGGAMKALNREIQGVAEQGLGAAFDRFSRGQQQRFSQLATLANGGLSASSEAGRNTTRAAEYGGTVGLTGATTAGGFQASGAQFNANAGMRSADIQADNTLRAGLFRADTERAVGTTRAGENLGRANAWNTALNAAGGAADGFISGGLDSGRGFNIRDAFRGYSRA